MKFEKPFKINTQLFAEENTPEQQTTDNSINAQSQVNQESKEKTVSKEVFDKTASELAEVKRKLRELEKNGKSDAEIKDLDLKNKDEELQKKNEELIKLYVQLNKANAVANISEIKAKINLDKNDFFDEVINALVTPDGELTDKRSKTFSKLVSAIYEKGIADAKSREWSSMSNGVKSGGNVNIDNEAKKLITEISKQHNYNTQSIKDKFK